MDGVFFRVFYIRKLFGEVIEIEVIVLGLFFGKVINIFMLKGKNQVYFFQDLYKMLSFKLFSRCKLVIV